MPVPAQVAPPWTTPPMIVVTQRQGDPDRQGRHRQDHRGAELGGQHLAPAGSEGERGQRGPLGPLGGHRQQADDRGEEGDDAGHPAAVVRERDAVGRVGERPAEGQHAQTDDEGQQPASATGVGGLAQLDAQQRAERELRGRSDRLGQQGGARWRTGRRLTGLGGRGAPSSETHRDIDSLAALAHAATSSSVVSVKNRSSRSAPPSRSSISTCRSAAARRPTCSGCGGDAQAACLRGRRQSGGVQGVGQAGVVEAADERALAGEQGVEAVVGDDPPAVDDDEPVDRRLHLAEQVAGQQHRATAGGEVLQEVAHPADALGVHAVGRLVEDQHLGVAEQRGADAEALAHPQRVVADAALGRAVQADPLEHLVGRRAVGDRAAATPAAASPGRCGRGAGRRRRASRRRRGPGLGSSA